MDAARSLGEAQLPVSTSFLRKRAQRELVASGLTPPLGAARLHPRLSITAILLMPGRLVFLTEDCAMPLSIHNLTTRYSIGSTLVQSGAPTSELHSEVTACLHGSALSPLLCVPGLSEPEGALHVLSSPIDAVMKEERAAVSCSDALHLQVAVAKVLAWCAVCTSRQGFLML